VHPLLFLQQSLLLREESLAVQANFSMPAVPSTSAKPHSHPELLVTGTRMEFVLRCNDLKCRSQLHDRAVAATCR
jgi:hypothetical protein